MVNHVKNRKITAFSRGFHDLYFLFKFILLDYILLSEIRILLVFWKKSIIFLTVRRQKPKFRQFWHHFRDISKLEDQISNSMVESDFSDNFTPRNQSLIKKWILIKKIKVEKNFFFWNFFTKIKISSQNHLFYVLNV